MSLSDITSIIKKEIEGYEEKLKLENVGHVMQVGDGVARIYGLDDCMSNELLEFPDNVYGIAMTWKRTTSVRSCWVLMPRLRKVIS